MSSTFWKSKKINIDIKEKKKIKNKCINNKKT